LTKKIERATAPRRAGTSYPPPYDVPCLNRERIRLGAAAGLSQFGVNLLRLPSGQWSSQRHWQHGEDEFVYILEGEVVMVTNAGEELLRPGDCAGFKAGDPDGHHLQNRSNEDALILEIGTRLPGGDGVTYPDIDLRLDAGTSKYLHADGRPYY
jgi:uncharacterized cupin superfamily protein